MRKRWSMRKWSVLTNSTDLADGMQDCSETFADAGSQRRFGRRLGVGKDSARRRRVYRR